MLDKLQTIAVATGSFTNKLQVNSVNFEYAKDSIGFTSLCGPLEDKVVTYNEVSKCTILSDTSSNLGLLYEIGLGAKSVSLGVATYNSNTNSILLNVLEEFPGQAISHSSMSVSKINLDYALGGLAQTTIELQGQTISSYPLLSLPALPIVSTSTATKGFVVSLSGYAGAIVNANVNIENKHKAFICMDGTFAGSTHIGKSISGTLLLDGAVKSLTSGSLSITATNHWVQIPNVVILALKEKVDNGIVYTEVSFVVPDNKLSVYFK